MAFATYWVHVFHPINRKLKNGIHLVEAEEWRNGWWRVRVPNAVRSTYVSPRVYNANLWMPYVGQPFGIAMQELHKLKEKLNGAKAAEPVSGPEGPVCELRGAEAKALEREAELAAFTRPDRVPRRRTIRKARRPKARSKA